MPDGQEEVIIFDGFALVYGNTANPSFANMGLAIDFDYKIRVDLPCDLPEYELLPTTKPIYFVRINLLDLHKNLLYNPSESSNIELSVNKIQVNNGILLSHKAIYCKL